MKFPIPRDFWRQIVLERMHRLLAIIIILQLIQCFSNYWWEETYSIIYSVLTVTAVTELLFTRGFLARFAFQCITVVGFVIWKTPYSWGGWPESWRVWDNVRSFLLFHTDQLHPFFELTVGVVFVGHVIAWIGKRRVGAIVVVITSILVMASIDSFFPLELWHNIAWVITAGLTWLVILHLRQLQARHPDSWEALAERPIDILFPAVVIITAVLLTGIFMPRAPALLEDPYTIWTEAQGREVPSFNGEGGVQKASSSGSSGSALSGYSRDDAAIGGGFEFDYSPVMTVTTTQRGYWRGETKAIYTGKGWGDRRNQNQMPINGYDGDFPLMVPRSDEVETKEVAQSVTIVRKDKLGVLFAASPVSSVSELKSDSNNGLRWNPEEWELKWSKPAQVESYSVISQVAVLDEAQLRKSQPASAATEELAPYLQLPDSLPERVRNLAEEQTAGLTNDYDRAKKLEQYLKQTFPYTNTPDLTKQSDRKNGDIVDAFLFEIQEGYCDYFSTSFVVMARSIGLPTRWVKGYSTGFDPDILELERFGGRPEVPDLTGAGTYTVRNSDAHSWAEVYFEGVGWIPFEPTSGFTLPVLLPEGEVATAEISVPANAETTEAGLTNAEKNWLVPAGALGVVVIIVFLVIFAYRNRRVGQLWSRIRYRGNTPNQRVVREMEKLLSFLHRKGFRRESHETLRETFTNWSGKFSSLRSDFDGVLTNFEQARYGSDKGNDQVLNEFTGAAERIRKAL